jgi:SAM domain (Sterile alpha motif)
MDVSAWLRGLGLERYAPAFRDNDIDPEILPELTADDLIGLGVTSIGHRRKVLRRSPHCPTLRWCRRRLLFRRRQPVSRPRSGGS